MPRKITILIADDHAMVRDGLSTILSLQDDFKIVGEASDGREAVEKANSLKPDIVLMDMMMPVIDGADATEEIKRTNPKAQILILTSFGNSARLSRAIAAGATGAISKTCTRNDLITSVRRVSQGKRVVSPEIEQTLSENQAIPELTQVQRDILTLLSRGLSNKDIAHAFGLSTAGVKFHLLALFRKLDVANRTEAVSLALRIGLVKPC